MSIGGTPRSTIKAALSHEYRRARLAFDEFAWTASVVITGRASRKQVLAAHDTYAMFVQSVFEFYKACIETDGQKHTQVKGANLDAALQAETVKLMALRADRIARGDASPSENSESYYCQPVPENFAKHMRCVRNSSAHVSIERTDPSRGVSLAEFYSLYHRYVMLLYEESYWLWVAPDEGAADWGEIDRFESALLLQYRRDA